MCPSLSKEITEGLEYSSMIECLPSVCEALGLMPSIEGGKKKYIYIYGLGCGLEVECLPSMHGHPRFNPQHHNNNDENNNSEEP